MLARVSPIVALYAASLLGQAVTTPVAAPAPPSAPVPAPAPINVTPAATSGAGQFGRVIGSFQAVKHLCAEMVAELEPCRALIWYAAYAFDEFPDQSRRMSAHAKAHTSEVGTFVARTATEVHGGMGFTDLLGLHYWFKRITFNRQVLGGPERCREEAADLQGWTLHA